MIAPTILLNYYTDNTSYEEEIFYEDEDYYDETFYHNWSADYHFSDFITDYELTSSLPEDGSYYETTLTPGLYVSGVHFAPGTYDLTAMDGYGYIANSFTDMITILEVDDITEDSYHAIENIELPCGAILEISDVLTIAMRSENADENQLLELDNPATDTYIFSAGTCITGDDFPAGIYDVSLYSEDPLGETTIQLSSGYIAYLYNNDSSNITMLRNIPFTEGTTLEISGDQVQLTPSEI